MAAQATSSDFVDIYLEPDFDQETELGDERRASNATGHGQLLARILRFIGLRRSSEIRTPVTDDTIGKCYVRINPIAVRYGHVEMPVSATATERAPSCLMALEVVFHPFRTKFKWAQLKFSFRYTDGPSSVTAADTSDDMIPILAHQPREIIGDEIKTTVKSLRSAGLQLGYQPFVQGSLFGQKNEEYKKRFYSAIFSSSGAVGMVDFTLEGNPKTTSGIPFILPAWFLLDFQRSGAFEVVVSWSAEIGAWQNVTDIVRRGWSGRVPRIMPFDGKTRQARIPDTFRIPEDIKFHEV